MEAEAQSGQQKKIIKKQLTGKRDDSELHTASRTGNLEAVLEIFIKDGRLKDLLSKQNQSGETALYVSAESGHADLIRDTIKYYNVACASIKARNGFDAFHIAAKLGHLEVVKVLAEAIPQLLATVDQSNATPLHSSAAQGHAEVVRFLLERNSGLATITRNNGKTALHSSARNGHYEVVKAILRSGEGGIATWTDKKGQTALHMAVKGNNTKVVDELIACDDGTLLSIVDGKCNSPLHVAARKCRITNVRRLLHHEGIDKEAINKSGETALDTAEKTGNPELKALLLEHGIRSAKSLTQQPKPQTAARELKQTVSDIKHEVHDQLEHTLQTRRRVRGIAKRLNKMQSEGLNNAITSTTVVSVLIATVAFAAIFTLPGQYASAGGEANIAPSVEFAVFLIFDSLALFSSLAVVVVQTSVVVVERKAKKQLMAVINKVMWLACAFVSIAFLAMCYVVMGKEERWLAVGVTVLGSLIMATTLGTMCYWVVMHRIEASRLRSLRRSGRSSRGGKSESWEASMMRESDGVEEDEYKNLYAL